MSNAMCAKLGAAVSEARERLAAAADAAGVEEVRIWSLGRNGVITGFSKDMKELDAAERRDAGRAFNEAKGEIQRLIDEAMERVSGKEARDAGAGLDLSLPGRAWRSGHRHPVSTVMDECVEIFRNLGFIVADGPEIETVWNNFDALNTPADHPSRDPGDTFYFADGRLLRTQTSPVQIRTMESHEPPVRIVAPGRTFRLDTPDATHSMNFHQIEGLYIDRGVSLGDLKAVLLHFAHEMFGAKVGIRMRPHFFPFTEPSVEVDFSCIMCEGKGCRICKNSGWLEIAGAGMVDPNVLTAVGYDAEKWTGYAFGMGIERIAMLRYRINDIRFLYENDARFLEQF